MTTTTITPQQFRARSQSELVELLRSDIGAWNAVYDAARYLPGEGYWRPVLRGADLRGADMRGAVLRGAVLRGADMRGADMRGADMRDAVLRGADMRGAVLRGAVLRDAVLSGADMRDADMRDAVDAYRHPLHQFRSDIWTILDAAPSEVAALRTALVSGKVDGSTYSGECACLCGTIAQAQGVGVDSLPGITPDAYRPAEQWFSPIEPGHTPIMGEWPGRGEWSSEGVFRASWALRWVDEWSESRMRIATALA